MRWILDAANLVIIGAIMSPIWFTTLVHIWKWDIYPRFIPAKEINQLAERLFLEFGQNAENAALNEEYLAWQSLETIQQGKWRRVRKELRRRHQAMNVRSKVYQKNQ